MPYRLLPRQVFLSLVTTLYSAALATVMSTALEMPLLVAEKILFVGIFRLAAKGKAKKETR